jgi:hypothetical protein
MFFRLPTNPTTHISRVRRIEFHQDLTTTIRLASWHFHPPVRSTKRKRLAPPLNPSPAWTYGTLRADNPGHYNPAQFHYPPEEELTHTLTRALNTLPFCGTRFFIIGDPPNDDTLAYETIGIPQLLTTADYTQPHFKPQPFPIHSTLPQLGLTAIQSYDPHTETLTAFTDGSYNKSTNILTGSIVLGGKDPSTPWNQRDVTVITINAGIQPDGCSYDGEIIPVAALTLATPDLRMSIITDSKSLIDRANTLKQSYFYEHFHEHQPLAHETTLPREGKFAGMLTQALYSHLDRIAFTHQRSHIDKPLSDYNINELGNHIADRAAAQDWAAILPLVRSLQYRVCELQEIFNPVEGLHLPFTINNDQSNQYTFAIGNSSTTIKHRRTQKLNTYLISKDLDHHTWHIAGPLIHKLSNHKLYYRRIAIRLCYNHTPTINYWRRRLDPESSPFNCPYGCPNTEDSVTHLLCHCRGNPSSLTSDFQHIRKALCNEVNNQLSQQSTMLSVPSYADRMFTPEPTLAYYPLTLPSILYGAIPLPPILHNSYE